MKNLSHQPEFDLPATRIVRANQHHQDLYCLQTIYLFLKKQCHKQRVQRAKKVVSNCPGLVDFAIRLVNFFNSVLNLPSGRASEVQLTEELSNQFYSSKTFEG